MGRTLSGAALLDKALARRRLTHKQKVAVCEHLLLDPNAPAPDGAEVRRAWSDIEIARLLDIPLDEVVTVRAKAVQRLVAAYRAENIPDHLIGTTLQHYQTNLALIDQSLHEAEPGSSSRLSHIKMRHQLIRDFLSDLQNLGVLPNLSDKATVEKGLGPGQLIRVLNDLSQNQNTDYLETLAQQGDVDDASKNT